MFNIFGKGLDRFSSNYVCFLGGGFSIPLATFPALGEAFFPFSLRGIFFPSKKQKKKPRLSILSIGAIGTIGDGIDSVDSSVYYQYYR